MGTAATGSGYVRVLCEAIVPAGQESPGFEGVLMDEDNVCFVSTKEVRR